MPNSSRPSDPAARERLLETFFADGMKVEMAGNKPLLLSDPSAFWVVTGGEVDIFAVLCENREPVGVRTHLFRAVRGAILFGTDGERPDPKMELIAVGKTGAELTRFERTEFSRTIQDSECSDLAANALEDFADGLSSGFPAKATPAGKYQHLESKGAFRAEEGDVLRTSRKVVWLTPTHGTIVLLDDKNLPPLPASEWFPLSGKLWLRSSTPSEMDILPSREILLSDKFWEIMGTFLRFSLEIIRIRMVELEQSARNPFHQRMEEDARKRRNALRRLGAVLFKKKERILEGVDEGEPIYAACRLVAEAAGMKIPGPPPAGLGEAAALTMEDVARAGNFFTREILLQKGWSREDNGPLLGSLKDADGNRPVALIPKSPRRYEMVDPQKGTRVGVTPELEEALHPVGYAFYRPFPAKPLSVWNIFSFALHGTLWDMLVVLGVGILGAMMALLIPIMTGVIINSVIPESSRGELHQIVFILLVSVFATLLFQVTRAVAMVRIEGKMDASLQAAVIDRMLALPAPFFRKFTAGDLANRSMGINQIRTILSGATLTTMMTCIFSSFNLILLFWYDWKLALVGLCLTSLSVLVTGALSAWMIRYQRKIFAIHGKLAGIILQLLTGIGKLRVTGTEDRAFAVWAEHFSKKKTIGFQTGKISAVLDTTAAFITPVATLLIFWFFFRFRVSELNTGDFLAFNTAYAAFQSAVTQMTLAFTGMLHVIPLYERARPILQALPEVDEAKGKVGNLSGDIEVDQVSFRYDPEGPLILKNVSLKAASSEFIAIVGGSGSGKSTLLRLLLGFEQPASGSISYDGQDMKDLDVRALRRQIGVVLQKGQVMAGDIFKNITGAAGMTVDDAWEAARMVSLADDIEAMPMGMHTVVSAGGTTLSGGQRQRLLIARAIVRRPRILFFDEATSALDNRTQAVVSQSIEKLHVTRIVIAHRLSTIINADRIYVLEHGKIIETGNYEELMANKGFFYELAKRQIA